jgi:phage-related tail fiber protein
MDAPPPPAAPLAAEAHTTVVIHPCSDVSLGFTEHDAMRMAKTTAAATAAAAAAAAAAKAHLLKLRALAPASNRSHVGAAGSGAAAGAAAGLPPAMQLSRGGPTFLARAVISFVVVLLVMALFAVLTIILISKR